MLHQKLCSWICFWRGMDTFVSVRREYM
jgi:hypothetical protein